MDSDNIVHTLEHLDLPHPARGELYANAQHRDCDHFYGHGVCGNDEYVKAVLLDAAKECCPDADFSGARIAIWPDANAAANRCPGFMPSFEYQEELRKGWEDVADTHREDMRRLAAMGR